MELLRRVPSYWLMRLSRVLSRWSSYVYQSPGERRVAAWQAAGGDERLRVEYELGPGAVVFDVGGYRGDWAAEMAARYGCRIWIFEPVEAFAAQITRRFAHNPRVRVFPFGLAGHNLMTRIALDRDASSTLKTGTEMAEAMLARAADVIAAEGIEWIDLMKINIEGGEYDLIEHLLASGYIRQIGNLQVQFHDVVPDALRRRQAIQHTLAVTHELTYQYPWIWENWHRKDARDT